MNKRVTMEDIGNALGLSRNTVIKAFNNHDDVLETTKKTIIKKAIEMGYKKINKEHLDLIQENTSVKNKNIGVIMSDTIIGDSSYWLIVIRGIQEAISKSGFNMITSFHSEMEEKELLMPQYVNSKDVAGVIIHGTLKPTYIDKILSTGIPSVLIDVPNNVSLLDINADIIMMENEESVFRITKHLIEKVKEDIGFIGDLNYCRTFIERWHGFKRAVEDSGFSINRELCMIDGSDSFYQVPGEKALEDGLNNLKKLPKAFVCANDRIAITIIKMLKEKGIKVPEDVMVTGFDNIGESTIIEPAISTIDNPKLEIGMSAGEKLLWRIENPSRPYEILRVKTKVVLRQSSGA